MRVVRMSPSENNDFLLNIEGESKFDVNIVEVSGYKGQAKGIDSSSYKARLMLANPLDDNDYTVNVLINGRQVGFLGYQDSHEYINRVNELGLRDFACECKARIRGGFLRDNGTRANFGISLNLNPKTMITLPNEPEISNEIIPDDQTESSKISTRSIIIFILCILVTIICIFSWAIW